MLENVGHVWEGDPGSGTLLRRLYKLLEDKARMRKPNCVVDAECKRRAADSGPGNFVQSYRALRSAFGVPAASEYERHVCPCCGHVYDYLTKEQCRGVPHERCPHCRHHRFKNCRAGTTPQPYKRMWVRPVGDIIESFFKDPDTVKAMDGLRSGPTANRGWSYPYYQWLDDVCRNRLTQPDRKEVAVMFCMGATPSANS